MISALVSGMRTAYFMKNRLCPATARLWRSYAKPQPDNAMYYSPSMANLSAVPPARHTHDPSGAPLWCNSPAAEVLRFGATHQQSRGLVVYNVPLPGMKTSRVLGLRAWHDCTS